MFSMPQTRGVNAITCIKYGGGRWQHGSRDSIIIRLKVNIFVVLLCSLISNIFLKNFTNLTPRLDQYRVK